MNRLADPELWTPARRAVTPQRCHLCGEHIPRCSPGSTTGTRGTKAFFNAALGLWECSPCRTEATRADLARPRHRPHVFERCSACAYEREDLAGTSTHPLFRLTHCDGCHLGAGVGVHRSCPRCGHLEHRTYELQPPAITRADAA